MSLGSGRERLQRQWCDWGAQSGENSELNKLNCTDVESESFGKEQIQELKLSVENSSFSEALAGSSHTWLPPVVPVPWRDRGTTGSTLFRRILRACFCTKPKCPRVFQNNGAPEDSKLSNASGQWGWGGKELDAPQVCVWGVQQQECDFHKDGRAGGYSQEECKKLLCCKLELKPVNEHQLQIFWFIPIF